MKISILGCGWLGLPLAESLIKDGHEVKGSTRDPEKLGQIREQGINPFLLELSPELICENPFMNFLIPKFLYLISRLQGVMILWNFIRGRSKVLLRPLTDHRSKKWCLQVPLPYTRN